MSIQQLIATRPEWIEPDNIAAGSAWDTLDPNPLVSAILFRRGLLTVDDARAFLEPTRQPHPDPYRIPNMDVAVNRLLQALANGESVGIFGDYDVDGMTSTAILTQALRVSLGETRVIARLPERHEGYGLNDTAIAEFKRAGVSLIVAVDCGSSDHTHAQAIADAGMDLVIFDHHHMPDSGPTSAIIVSPQLNGDGMYHDLTAAGIAYLAIVALAEKGIPVTTEPGDDPATYLDLAALGTVADVAPLVGVNRYLVARGLELIRARRRVGIQALVNAADLKIETVTATNISFALAPRLNSAGRIETPRLAFQLLMATSLPEANRLAAELEQVNFRRRTRSAQVLAEAYAEITSHPGWERQPVFAVHHSGWEPGLVGAVASRMVEEVRRPVFLFREENGTLFGSARSIEGFNLVKTLQAADDLLERFGGHSLAAGLSLPLENLPGLRERITAALGEIGLPVPAPRQLRIDATLPADYLQIKTVRDLARMEPFGRGNEQPILRISGAGLDRYTAMGADRSHLKIFAKAGKRSVEAVFWGAAHRSSEMVGRRSIDLVGRLEINDWNGQERLQMVLDDFRAS